MIRSLTRIKSNIEAAIMGYIATIILIILGVIIGGISLPFIVGIFSNVFMWIVVMVAVFIFKPEEERQFVWAAIIGFMFWGIAYYLSLVSPPWFCNIPLIGGTLCTGYRIVEFIPQMFALLIHIGVAFVEVSILMFLGKEIKNR